MIRPAKAEDAAWICKIWNAEIEGSTATFTTEIKPLDAVRTLIAARLGAFLVAAEDGFATFGPFRDGPGYADAAEVTLYLRAAAQGAGLGRLLLARLEEHARAAGKRNLVAGISGSNPRATRFFLREAYLQVAHMPGIGQKWGERLDLVLLQKNLQDGRQED